MIVAKTKETDFRMSGSEFDRIMGQALRVTPKDRKKTKGVRKTKKAHKKQLRRK